MRRRELIRLAGAGTLASMCGAARSQGAAPLRIVVGFAAGGSTDVMSRLLADPLRASLGRPAVVENKTGASGRLALELVKSLPPDGDALAHVPHGAMTLFPHVYRSLRYDPTNDFTAISRISTGDYCLAVGAQSPARDIAGFTQWAKSRDNRLSFGSPGAGTVLHFLGIRIGRGLGITLAHIPYRGAAPAVTDLIGGTVDAIVVPLSDALEMHRSGKARILATTGATRTRQVAGVPTMKESGVDLDVPAWTALYGPAGMPTPLVEKLQSAVRQALQVPTLEERFAAMGLAPAPLPGAELMALQRAETALWAGVVKASGFTPEE